MYMYKCLYNDIIAGEQMLAKYKEQVCSIVTQ